MNFFSRNHLFAFALTASMVLLAPRFGWTQAVVSAGEGRITIDAESVSLERFFDELSKIVTVEFLQLAPNVKQVPVTLRLSEVEPVLGVHKFLEKAGVDYAVSGGDGKPFRIIVGALGDPKLSAFRPESSMEEEAAAEGYTEETAPGDAVEDGAFEPEVEGEMPPRQPSGQRPTTGMAGSGLTGTSGRQKRSNTGMGMPGAPGGAVPPSMNPTPREGPPPRPKQQPRVVTGGSFVTTGSAGLRDGPAKGRVAAAGGILAFGLSLGLVLVGRVDG